LNRIITIFLFKVVTVTPGLTNLPDFTPGAKVEPGDNPVEIKQNQEITKIEL